LLLPLSLSAAADAAPQQEERQIRREVVVIGSRPEHRHMIVDHLAHRGYLGVQLLNLTPELRQHFGASRENGVLVSRVLEEGPAAAAGVLVGDVITAVDGDPVQSTSQVVGRIGGLDEGDEVGLEIVRDRSPLALRATLAQSKRRQLEVGQFVWRGGEGAEGPFVLDLDPEQMRQLVTVEPGEADRFIAVDPEAINESVSKLLERLEAAGDTPGLMRLDDERRALLERRIAELEERLLSMEREIQRVRDESR
jgi:membrane-associated protease RseP (regulator of RpoE activity)